MVRIPTGRIYKRIIRAIGWDSKSKRDSRKIALYFIKCTVRTPRNVPLAFLSTNILSIAMLESYIEASDEAGLKRSLIFEELQNGCMHFLILFAAFHLALKIQNGPFYSIEPVAKALRGIPLSKSQLTICAVFSDFLQFRFITSHLLFFAAPYFIYFGNMPFFLKFMLPFLLAVDTLSIFISAALNKIHKNLRIAFIFLLYLYMAAIFVGVAWDFPWIYEAVSRRTMDFGGTFLAKILFSGNGEAWPVWTISMIGLSALSLFFTTKLTQQKLFIKKI